VFYKSNFCGDCGERIERENRKWWDSRLFCDDCAPKLDNFPSRVVKYLIGTFVLTGFGFIVASSISEKKPSVVLNQNQAISSPRQNSNGQIAQTNQNANAQVNAKPTNQVPPKASPQTLISAPHQIAPGVAETTETAYFCGARTQKGAPCSRRVRRAGRCWQHVGKPAMLPDEKLKITQ
jgi:hypothetical protein